MRHTSLRSAVTSLGLRPTILALAVVAVAGCKKAERQAAPAPAPAPAPVAAARAPDPEGAEAMRTLAGRLSFEAAHRPSGTATVEAVFAALATAGITVDGTKQYIALTAAASYCAGGRTADGLAVAVCEYESAAAAAAGRDHVATTFANVPGRQIAIRGATTLTTTTPDGQDLTALRAKAESAFAAM